jgi:hypothetical protein
MRWKGLLAGTIVTLLAGAAPAAADTFVVDTTADLTGTTCPQGACSIRRAVVVAEQTAGADSIQVPAGAYPLTQGPLVVTQPVTITGASARTTAIFATAGARVIDVANTTATISHVTLSSGTADSSNGFHGGDLRAQASTVTLDHVRVTNGSASSGGGIANRNGTMLIVDSLVDHNAADTGGGDGGGILNFGGDGGGPAVLTVRDSTVAGNSARLVGGIIQYGDPGDLTVLEGATLAINQTGDRGGPGNLSVDGQGASLRNTILATSLGASGPAPNCDGPTTSAGANVADDAACGLVQAGDRPGIDARLQDGLYTDGGETDVIPFYPDSPARDIGGTCSGLDQADRPRPSGAACDAGAWELRGATIESGPEGVTRDRQPSFAFSGADTPTCQVIPRDETDVPCSSPYRVDAPLADGDYELRVYSADGTYVARSFTVDTTAPGAPSVGEGLAFSGEPGARFECSLDGGAFVACASPYGTLGVAPGEHTLAVRAVDGAGNVGPAGARRFTVAGPAGGTTGAGSGKQAPPPGPTPVRDRSVLGTPSGTVLIKTGGKGAFVPFRGGLLPNGTEIDATRGAITITTAAGETATFTGGRFKVSQHNGLTTLTLSQPLDCPTTKKSRTRTRTAASAAAAKVKKRRLWGDGKGNFRTQGSYSAATVRGTKWLVEDTCTTTLTRVARGLVSVRDEVLRKTVLVPKGKSYTARARRR